MEVLNGAQKREPLAAEKRKTAWPRSQVLQPFKRKNKLITITKLNLFFLNSALTSFPCSFDALLSK